MRKAATIITSFLNAWPRVAQRLIDLVFHDQARLVEWMSLMTLFGFLTELWTNPAILDRPGFAGFAVLPRGAWLAIVTACAVVQAIAILVPGRRSADLRFFAIAMAFGFWVTVTISFLSTAISSTAPRTYGALAIVTLAAGVFLAWTSTSRR